MELYVVTVHTYKVTLVSVSHPFLRPLVTHRFRPSFSYFSAGDLGVRREWDRKDRGRRMNKSSSSCCFIKSFSSLLISHTHSLDPFLPSCQVLVTSIPSCRLALSSYPVPLNSMQWWVSCGALPCLALPCLAPTCPAISSSWSFPSCPFFRMYTLFSPVFCWEVYGRYTVTEGWTSDSNCGGRPRRVDKAVYLVSCTVHYVVYSVTSECHMRGAVV